MDNYNGFTWQASLGEAALPTLPLMQALQSLEGLQSRIQTSLASHALMKFAFLAQAPTFLDLFM